MHKTAIAFLLGILLLTSCNLPTRFNAVPTNDTVATQVSQLLTQMPTATGAANPTTAQAQPSATTAPSATANPTATSAPVTPTVLKATPTTVSGDPKNALGTPTWQDTLETSQQFHLYDNGHTRVTADNGALLFTGINADGWLGWSLTFSQQPQNFYLEGVFTPQTCSGADLYGIVFRAPDTDSGYFFGVTCDGKYSLHARNLKDGSDNPLIKTTANSAIQTGSNVTNRLGVMANGEKISLYANGNLLQEINDTTYPDKGYFGGFVAANNTPEFTYRLDEMTLWKLP